MCVFCFIFAVFPLAFIHYLITWQFVVQENLLGSRQGLHNMAAALFFTATTTSTVVILIISVVVMIYVVIILIITNLVVINYTIIFTIINIIFIVKIIIIIIIKECFQHLDALDFNVLQRFYVGSYARNA